MGTELIEVYDDPQGLAAGAAARFIVAARGAIAARGRFLVALAGGSTPELTYQLLSKPGMKEQVDWSKTWIVQGDERFVPADDSASNWRMARRALLDHVPIPSAQLFPFDTLVKSPGESAQRYAQTLAALVKEPGSMPRMDLIFLGLGEDGHTASLFPHQVSLHEESAWVVACPPGVLPPPVDRMTFTFPLLNASREAVFLVAGVKKARVLAKILAGEATRDEYPAAGVQPVEGTRVWLLDRAAAGKG